MQKVPLRGSATYFHSPETVFTIKRRVWEFKTRATILHTKMKKEENKSSDHPIGHTLEKKEKSIVKPAKGVKIPLLRASRRRVKVHNWD